ncbi:hypothetical protein GCM10027155_21690 [Acinetobacter apis]|uniref:Glycosyltransferase like family protein n=1 Tax=Acinetobacter apis TaxID=1229165 RepID=A0A217EI10_9GAMM|nr:acyl esterase [Acinetobacter apis]SNQ29952.1 hypothetical protein SAMN05444584_1931 [Acinetobacter apis]
MQEIIKKQSKMGKISFYTLVTRFSEYTEMVESAKSIGFQTCNFFYFDNKKSNDFDGFSGLNYALKHCTSDYMIFCHQDIIFNFDTKNILIDKINELEQLDPNWAIIGNAGVTEKGEVILKITDPHGPNQTKGPFPSQVMSVDENFMVINTKHNLSCSTQMKGFHLYGLDLCQNAANLGLKSYVVDFHLTHKSKGNIDHSFFTARDNYIKIQEERKRIQFFFTTCTKFLVSNTKLFNVLLNNKVALKLLSILLKFKR